MADIPPCANSLRPSTSPGYCPSSDTVIAWECGPAQATIAYVVFCRTCKLVQYLNTPEYHNWCAKLAMEEAARKEESETARKRRRFSIFFGVRNASDATRRF